MGKKSRSNGGGGGGGEKGKAAAAAAFVLRVAMHCRCHGCMYKIGKAVKELPLVDGVEAVDRSALETKGEVSLLATADPERLRDRLHRATGKKVDILLPKAEAKPAGRKPDLGLAADEVAQAQALLLNHLNLNLPAQYGEQGAWANQLLLPPGAGAGGYVAAAAPHVGYNPWAVQVQQPAWGPYAPASYPPAPAQAQGHGGAPAMPWHTYGAYY